MENINFLEDLLVRIDPELPIGQNCKEILLKLVSDIKIKEIASVRGDSKPVANAYINKEGVYAELFVTTNGKVRILKAKNMPDNFKTFPSQKDKKFEQHENLRNLIKAGGSKNQDGSWDYEETTVELPLSSFSNAASSLVGHTTNGRTVIKFF